MSDQPPAAHPAPPPPPPPPRRRSATWLRVIAILAVVFLLGSLAMNFVLLVTIGAVATGLDTNPASKVDTEIVHSAGSDRIAILPIVGTIDGAQYTRVNLFCDAIEASTQIKAVVLEVDSPGGGITASDDIYNRLLTLKKRRGFKVWVSMQGLAASGGYYVSMAGDKLYAERTSLTGSIGVIWPSFELTKMLDKIGVTPEVIKSDEASTYKDAGSPWKRFTEEDRAYIRGLVNNAHERFKKVVEEGRDKKLLAKIDDVAIGRIWPADEALKLGLIDEIGYRDDVCDALARDSGLVQPTIVRLKERHSILDTLTASTSLGSPKVSIEVSPKLLDEIRSPRMEYRWQP